MADVFVYRVRMASILGMLQRLGLLSLEMLLITAQKVWIYEYLGNMRLERLRVWIG